MVGLAVIVSQPWVCALGVNVLGFPVITDHACV